MFLFAAVDAMAKLLTAGFDPLQIAWTRQIGLLGLALPLLVLRGRSVLSTAQPGRQVIRGAIAAISPVLFITAVAVVPLADAMAVAFVAPFMVTILASALLREPIGPRRWTAVCVGFLGAMVVIRPGFGVVDPAVGLVFIAAALFAVRQIMSRSLARHDPVETTIAYTALSSTAVLSVPLVFVWTWPSDSETIGLLATVALLAGAGEAMVIKALQVAEAAVVAPMQYTLLIWGSLYGYLLFGETPDIFTFIGAGIIVGSGLYMLRRERG